MTVYEFADWRDSKLDTPRPKLSVKFIEVIYDNQYDHEYVPHVFYDHRGVGAEENLGPMDFEMSGDGKEIYIDGVSGRAQVVFKELGDIAWQLVVDDVHRQLPLAEKVLTEDYEVFPAEREETTVVPVPVAKTDLPLAA